MKRWFSRQATTPAATPPLSGNNTPAITPLEQAQALQRRANELRNNGDLAAALACYQSAAMADASYLPARLGAGLVHLDQQNYLAARDSFAAAHDIDPNALDPLYFLAQCDEMLGEPLRSFEGYQRALDVKASFLPALRALAPLAARLGRIETAERYLKAAIASSDDLEFHLLLGITLYAAGRHRECIAEFDAVLHVDPARLEALINKAEALMSLEQTEHAEALVARLNALAPERADVMLLSARTLFNTGHVDQAAAKATELLALDPRSAMAEFVLGLVHWSRSNAAAARQHWQRALTLDPGLSAAGLWIATLLFFEKDYHAAWDAYEARFGAAFGSVSIDGLLLRRLSGGRRWSGEADLAGTLYIWAEQGFGDTMMLLPVIANAAERFQGRVYFFCPPELRRLAEQLVAPQLLLSSRSEIPDHALHCPLYSVPAVLQNATQSTFEPKPRLAYLKAPDAANAKFHARLAQLRGKKIGIIWDGFGGYKANLERSVPLRLFSSIADIPGVTLVSLQKNPPASDVAAAAFALIDWTDDISDFADTAAIMQGLDLVISIDSAPAHLAGALGVPVWLLNRFDGEWRWGRARSDNDWYQSMRVFYQSTRGDWTAVFKEMADLLSRQMAQV